jgi:DNA-binding NarL/FixJ family response regulator
VIRVVIADDHAIVRQGLAGLLEGVDDLSVVGLAADGEEAVALVREHRPDVVLMDLQMPGVDGVDATRTIVEEALGTEVLVLTSFSDHARILAAIDAGAVGYLLKDADPAELIDGVRAVARGESPLDPRAARHLLRPRSAPSDQPVDHPVDLSPRETQVLRLVVEGLLNKQIAQRLGISERTVKAHLTSIFQRTGVADRTQAALWAQRHGL